MPAAELGQVDQISRLRWRRICRRISSGLSMAMASRLASDWPRRSSGMAWIAAANSSTDVANSCAITIGSNRMRLLSSKCVVSASSSSNPLAGAVPGRARIRYALPPTPSKPGGLMWRIVARPLAARRRAARARCSDLSPGGCASQVINDCAADADGLVLGQRRSEEVAPLTGASQMVGGALNVHAPQCTSQTGRPERPDWGACTGERRV